MSPDVIEIEAIRSAEERSGGATRRPVQLRPYALSTLVEFVAGPAPDEGSCELVRSFYLRSIQGMYVMFGRNHRWWIRKAKSGLTVYEADELACWVGEHPSAIWKTWFDDAISEIAWALRRDVLDGLDPVDRCEAGMLASAA